MLWFAVALFLVGAIMTSVEADTPSELVRQLGSSSYPEREAAMRELSRLGEAALPLLQDALRSSDAEVRRRAMGLVHAIDDARFRAEVFRPRPVRFRFHDTSLRHALYEIERATGLSFKMPTATGWGERKITVDTGELPFWQAWTLFAERAGLKEMNFVPWLDPLAELILREETATDPPVAMDAPLPLRVRARRPSTALAVFREAPLPSYVLEFWADPRLSLLELTDVRLLAARDHEGRPFPLGDSRVVMPGEPESSSLVEYKTGNVLVPKRGWLVPVYQSKAKIVPKLTELKGEVTANFVVRLPTITVDHFLTSAGKSFAAPSGLTLKVLQVAETTEGDVVARLQFDRFQDELDARLGAAVKLRPQVVVPRSPSLTLLPPLALSDRKGQLWHSEAIVRRAATDGRGEECRITFQGRAGSRDELRLAVLSQRIVTVRIPFALKDVPVISPHGK